MSADRLYKQAIEALRFLLIAPPAGGKARGGRELGTEAQWPMSAAASHHLGRGAHRRLLHLRRQWAGACLRLFQAADGGLRALTVPGVLEQRAALRQDEPF